MREAEINTEFVAAVIQALNHWPSKLGKCPTNENNIYFDCISCMSYSICFSFSRQILKRNIQHVKFQEDWFTLSKCMCQNPANIP